MPWGKKIIKFLILFIILLIQSSLSSELERVEESFTNKLQSDSNFITNYLPERELEEKASLPVNLEDDIISSQTFPASRLMIAENSTPQFIRDITALVNSISIEEEVVPLITRNNLIKRMQKVFANVSEAQAEKFIKSIENLATLNIKTISNVIKNSKNNDDVKKLLEEIFEKIKIKIKAAYSAASNSQELIIFLEQQKKILRARIKLLLEQQGIKISEEEIKNELNEYVLRTVKNSSNVTIKQLSPKYIVTSNVIPTQKVSLTYQKESLLKNNKATSSIKTVPEISKTSFRAYDQMKTVSTKVIPHVKSSLVFLGEDNAVMPIRQLPVAGLQTYNFQLQEQKLNVRQAVFQAERQPISTEPTYFLPGQRLFHRNKPPTFSYTERVKPIRTTTMQSTLRASTKKGNPSTLAVSNKNKKTAQSKEKNKIVKIKKVNQQNNELEKQKIQKKKQEDTIYHDPVKKFA